MSATATRPSTRQPDTDSPTIPVAEFFSLDVRSLALFRVMLGLLLFLDWVDRWPDVIALYSDSGIFPRNALTGIQPISVHVLHGSAWFTAILFALATVCSLFVLVGWKTPFFTLVSWFLLVSIHARAPAIMTGGDHLLRAITFWSIFLPLGACWSIDASRPGSQPSSSRVLSPASFAYLAQICIVYWFAAAWKWLGPWREEGTAVYLTLAIDHLPNRVGLLLKEFPNVCRALTHATIWLETLGPVVLFLPFNVALQRLLVIPAFILFHAGLALTLELGHFPFVCMVFWLPLLPSAFWDRLWSQLRKPEVASLTLFYDPDAPRLVRWLQRLRTFLFLGESSFEPAREKGGQLARLRQHGGWAVVDGQGQEHTGVDALALLTSLSALWSPLTRLARGKLGAWFVTYIARGPRQRHALEEVPQRPGWVPPGGLIAATVVLFCLSYVFVCNAVSFVTVQMRDLNLEESAKYLPLMPEQVHQLGMALGLEQGWGLFAPEPGRRFGWYEIVGTRKDGTQVDVLTGEPFTGEKPANVSLSYASSRWRKLFMNLAETTSYPYLLPGFTRYYFDKWNREHKDDEQLRLLEVYWWREYTVPHGETPAPAERVRLGWYQDPVPFSDDGTWLLVVGTSAKGKEYDLMRDGIDVNWDKPKPFVTAPITNTLYPFLVEIVTADASYLWPEFTRYLLEQWNKRNADKPDKQIQSLEILRLKEDRPGKPRRAVLARYEGKRP